MGLRKKFRKLCNKVAKKVKQNVTHKVLNKKKRDKVKKVLRKIENHSDGKIMLPIVKVPLGRTYEIPPRYESCAPPAPRTRISSVSSYTYSVTSHASPVSSTFRDYPQDALSYMRSSLDYPELYSYTFNLELSDLSRHWISVMSRGNISLSSVDSFFSGSDARPFLHLKPHLEKSASIRATLMEKCAYLVGEATRYLDVVQTVDLNGRLARNPIMRAVPYVGAVLTAHQYGENYNTCRADGHGVIPCVAGATAGCLADVAINQMGASMVVAGAGSLVGGAISTVPAPAVGLPAMASGIATISAGAYTMCNSDQIGQAVNDRVVEALT